MLLSIAGTSYQMASPNIILSWLSSLHPHILSEIAKAPLDDLVIPEFKAKEWSENPNAFRNRGYHGFLEISFQTSYIQKLTYTTIYFPRSGLWKPKRWDIHLSVSHRYVARSSAARHGQIPQVRVSGNALGSDPLFVLESVWLRFIIQFSLWTAVCEAFLMGDFSWFPLHELAVAPRKSPDQIPESA